MLEAGNVVLAWFPSSLICIYLGGNTVFPQSLLIDWEILYYILEDVLCARHLAKCFLRALSPSLNYCYPHFTKEEIKASPLLSRLAPQPTAVPPPRGRFGNLRVLWLVLTMMRRGQWRLTRDGGGRRKCLQGRILQHRGCLCVRLDIWGG